MVSLLNGPHTILVFTKERVEDEMGYELVDRPPIRLTGVTVQAYFGQSGACLLYTSDACRRAI